MIYSIQNILKKYTKIGDVFSAKTNENTKKYFQLIAYDLTQLNSDVIRVFKEQYPINSNTVCNVGLYIILSQNEG